MKKSSVVEKKRVSVDNGVHFCSVMEALKKHDMDTLAYYMDDGTREQVHNELAPCTDEEFLERYLELAPWDLIIG